jgi:hypothetical protein
MHRKGYRFGKTIVTGKETRKPTSSAEAEVPPFAVMSSPLPEGSTLLAPVTSRQNTVNRAYCGERATGAHHCSNCLGVFHAICGSSTGDEGFGTQVECFQCRPENNTL